MIIPSSSFASFSSIKKPIVAAGGGDVTPNAVNWSNLTYDGGGANPYNITVKQITGINQSITLQLTYTSSVGEIRYKIAENANNEGTYTGSLTGYTLVSSGGTFIVNNNEYVEFLISETPAYTGLMSTFTITVTNVTDSNTILDTFTAEGFG